MFKRVFIVGAAVAALSVGGLPALSQTPPRSVVSEVFREEIPNLPGKSMVAVLVNYAPGATAGGHRHAPSAFIYARVLQGSIRSQVNDSAPHVFNVGDSWHESPGDHHKMSQNASSTEPAQLLAVFVIDSDETQLTTPDPQ